MKRVLAVALFLSALCIAAMPPAAPTIADMYLGLEGAAVAAHGVYPILAVGVTIFDGRTGGRVVVDEFLPAVVDPSSGLLLDPGVCPNDMAWARVRVGNVLEANVGGTDDVTAQVTIPALLDFDGGGWVSIDPSPTGKGRYPVIPGHRYAWFLDVFNNAAYFPRPSGAPASDITAGKFWYEGAVAYFPAEQP